MAEGFELERNGESAAKRELGERGMTLIEVIAVIVLITLIMVTVGKNVFTASSGAKAKLNETKMETLRGYLGQYRLQYNTYPSKLDNLIHESAEIKAAGGAFIPLAQENDLKDVYNNPYIYSVGNNGRTYELKSLGEDMLEGGEGTNKDLVMRP